MRYISTRGQAPPVPFIDALFAGTAPDGGLYMPERVDPLPPGTVEALRGASLVDIGTVVGLAHREPQSQHQASQALPFASEPLLRVRFGAREVQLGLVPLVLHQLGTRRVKPEEPET